LPFPGMEKHSGRAGMPYKKPVKFPITTLSIMCNGF
jgi:hypothetical protein